MYVDAILIVIRPSAGNFSEGSYKHYLFQRKISRFFKVVTIFEVKRPFQFWCQLMDVCNMYVCKLLIVQR